MRLFIGIPLRETTQQQIFTKLQTFGNMDGYRFGKPENYHITLLFLGETQINPSLFIDSLSQVPSQVDPIEFTLQQLNGFPTNNRAVSMGLMVLPKEPFLLLKEKIIDALSVYGFRMGKEMIPHVTISRMKHAVNIQDLQKKWKFTAIKQIADSFVLYQSVLQPAGPIYHQLHRFQLKGVFHG